MGQANLAQIYRDYIACLNNQDWPQLDRFVDEYVIHNGRPLGLTGYREMLEQDFRDIPDLRFNIELLTVSATLVGSRLVYDCAPRGVFLGLPVMGRRIIFPEHVFYEFSAGRIVEVWSVIDKAAIETQLSPARTR